ncbi:hypothetical protein MOX02_21780 [Methylobacterium oxalidis]|uniref:Uncharacterized protein n=1 Tax=Methylobacterium oxalidis TaxID=944322 RepID=A0A512J2G0_9HYPH|nr:hypothetical protein [Methylobacterium oxalidis]GEP04140.1 hypothetical protein MOX02_21780 [Methylobacterium oxalidis]GJE35265.1 hypothetical protein LDDCCGHA_5483 [Methylobacterium oxalidis]GLS65031.1 hypothetical protein GCM10007888_34120 [Methylobacterium oxalidis]
MNGSERSRDRSRDWSLSVAAAEDGVRLEFGLNDLDGRPLTAILDLDRGEARNLARALLAAAGDAMERTFPHPASGD